MFRGIADEADNRWARRWKTLQCEAEREGEIMEPRFRRGVNLTVILLAIGVVHGACGRSEAPTVGGTDANPPAQFVPDLKPVPEAKWVEGKVPKGTPIKISLIDILTSQTSHKGDSF